MLNGAGFVALSFVLTNGGISASGLAETDAVRSAAADWAECALDRSPTDCLEERTVRKIRELNDELTGGLPLGAPDPRRAGKLLDGGSENAEAEDALELENRNLLRGIDERRTEPRGILDEIGDLFASLTFRLLDPFTGGTGDEDSSENNTEQEDEAAPEERGHKKKELKKKNKQLKLILLLMLLKNKIKMFVNKLQFLVQLKFLLVATVNMLANVIRLWIELKKKHKPNKVVYYENAHHQHHYDHEHVHDHDDDHHHHYSHPGSYSHHAHHEEEDYGGGPWPWSRSYAEKRGEASRLGMSPYARYPASHGAAYLHQRPLR